MTQPDEPLEDLSWQQAMETMTEEEAAGQGVAPAASDAEKKLTPEDLKNAQANP